MIDPAHVRMARAALNWTLTDITRLSGLDKNTVSRYETGRPVHSTTIEKLEELFIKHGVVFIYEDERSGHGVRLSKKAMLEARSRKMRKRVQRRS